MSPAKSRLDAHDSMKRALLLIALLALSAGCCLASPVAQDPKPAADAAACAALGCDNASTVCDLASQSCLCRRGFERPKAEQIRENPMFFTHMRLPVKEGEARGDPSQWEFPEPNATHCWDVDECVRGGCADGCQNLPGSFLCECPIPGTRAVLHHQRRTSADIEAGDNAVCADVDECAQQDGTTHECAESATCVNLDAASAEVLPRHPLTGEAVGYKCECKGDTTPHPVLNGLTPHGCVPPGALPGPCGDDADAATPDEPAGSRGDEL